MFVRNQLSYRKANMLLCWKFGCDGGLLPQVLVSGCCRPFLSILRTQDDTRHRCSGPQLQIYHGGIPLRVERERERREEGRRMVGGRMEGHREGRRKGGRERGRGRGWREEVICTDEGFNHYWFRNFIDCEDDLHHFNFDICCP